MLWDCILALCDSSEMSLVLANAKFNSWLAWDNYTQKKKMFKCTNLITN